MAVRALCIAIAALVIGAVAGPTAHAVLKNAQGKADPKLGAEAMLQALDVHRSGVLRDTPAEEHVRALAAHAEQTHLTALREALRQRYPGVAG